MEFFSVQLEQMLLNHRIKVEKPSPIDSSFPFLLTCVPSMHDCATACSSRHLDSLVRCFQLEGIGDYWWAGAPRGVRKAF